MEAGAIEQEQEREWKLEQELETLDADDEEPRWPDPDEAAIGDVDLVVGMENGAPPLTMPPDTTNPAPMQSAPPSNLFGPDGPQTTPTPPQQ